MGMTPWRLLFFLRPALRFFDDGILQAVSDWFAAPSRWTKNRAD
jgi:hypothetical protein